jgi:hypothetical protein
MLEAARGVRSGAGMDRDLISRHPCHSLSGRTMRSCSDGAAVAIPLDVAFSLRLISVLRRQRAGLASAAAVMIGVKAIATMAGSTRF